MSSTTRYADGSSLSMSYGIVGEAYTQQASTTNAAGKQTEFTRWYGDANRTVAMTYAINPDGSTETHSYDTAGRETTRILTAADGSKDVFTSTYAGTSGTASTVQQYHYATGGQQLWTDVAAADGSHKMTAQAAGVSLTSHTAVADTFTAAAGGTDTFVFKPAFGQDIITNFHAGSGATHDTLDLRGLGLTVNAGQSSLDVLTPLLKQVGRDALLSITPTDTITLKNTIVASLASQDFTVA